MYGSCSLRGLVLIAVGTGAIRIVTGMAPWVLEVLRWGGVIYLVAFALTSFRFYMQLRKNRARISALITK